MGRIDAVSGMCWVSSGTSWYTSHNFIIVPRLVNYLYDCFRHVPIYLARVEEILYTRLEPNRRDTANEL